MRVYYIENLRLQLWFDSPNYCAAFLSMTVLLSIGCFCFCTGRKGLGWKIIAILLGGAVLWQQYMLAMTYSRGGYLAFAAGLMAYWLICRRHQLWWWSASFGIMLLLTANGIDRVNSIRNLGEGSIYHRLLLWRGGLQIIGEHLTGVGLDRAGATYTAWLQPLWLNEHYNSMINDYLSFGVAWGIFALFGYLLGILIPMSLGWELWRKNRVLVLPAILAVMISYMVSSCFSTMHSIQEIFWTFCGVGLVLALVLAYHITFRHFRPRIRVIIIPVAAAVLVCAVIWVTGRIMAENMPYRYLDNKLQGEEGPLAVTEAIPRHHVPRALLIVIASDNVPSQTDVTSLNLIIRTMVRPLVIRNYRVIVASVNSGFTGAKNVATVLRKYANGPDPVFLIGEGDGGKQAINAAAQIRPSNLRGIITVGAPAEWPFEELSPLHNLPGITVPLMFLHGEKDIRVHADNAQKFYRFCVEKGIPAECHILKNADADLTGQRELVTEMIDQFITGKLKENTPLELTVFARPGCRHCREFEPVLKQLTAKYRNRLLIRRHDLSTGNEAVCYAAYCRRYGIADTPIMTPAVFVSESHLAGEDAIRSTEPVLAQILSQSQPVPTQQPTVEDLQEAEQALFRKFQSLPFFTIIIAGLIDGINPCVFSTLVFFISLLSVSKIKHRKLLLAGCVYCLACYMTYFSMGLGILSLFNVINQFKSAGLIMNYTMIGLLAILIFFSLRDAYYFRKTGKAGAVTLQLPDYMKTKIHDLMRKGLRYRFLIPGAFFIGICVTIIESACTAQVYIPTLGIISKHGGMSATVILYLALYNLMCIVPLLTVFAFAYYGTTTNTFIRWTKNDLVMGKLLMSLLFILLAILLIFSIN